MCQLHAIRYLGKVIFEGMGLRIYWHTVCEADTIGLKIDYCRLLELSGFQLVGLTARREIPIHGEKIAKKEKIQVQRL